MRRRSARGYVALAALCAGLAPAGAAPLAGGADPSELPSRASELRAAQDSLATDRRSALLQLYALESDLASARADMSALEAERAAVAHRRAATGRRLAIARRAAALSTRRLDELVRVLYERGGVSGLEILLTSRSLNDALTGLEGLERAAADHRRILLRSRSTRARLARLSAELGARERQLDRLAAAAAERARQLETSSAAKTRYLADLRRRQKLTAGQVRELEAAARTAQRQAAAVTPATPPAEARPSASARGSADDAAAIATAAFGARTLTVTAIGYSLRGTTASGLPVGHGIAAVDPTVIPLGTRLSVPGYGEAVAADTGAAIRGAVVDLWFPTEAEAEAWGRRTVVVTLG